MMLLFASSNSCTSVPFELLHFDVWTSPVPSISGCLYYLVISDDFNHYCWTFPMQRKSKVHHLVTNFFQFARAQFNSLIKCSQADNGREFVNNASSSFLTSQGTLLQPFCSYTSDQNGKVERIFHILNNFVRTLLLHASMSPPY
jgi:transposase InsO family protein